MNQYTSDERSKEGKVMTLRFSGEYCEFEDLAYKAYKQYLHDWNDGVPTRPKMWRKLLVLFVKDMGLKK